jgi:Xrn1 helical domain
MKDPQSPVLDFYPTDFRVDQEGKRNDWEGIVLVNLPFHDRQKLLTFGIVLVTHPLMMKFLVMLLCQGQKKDRQPDRAADAATACTLSADCRDAEPSLPPGALRGRAAAADSGKVGAASPAHRGRANKE